LLSKADTGVRRPQLQGEKQRKRPKKMRAIAKFAAANFLAE
jgi:hypothetical protein